MNTSTASTSEMERETVQLLRRIGITGKYTAHPYLIHIIKLLCEADDPHCSLKYLYLSSSKRFHTSIDCVERDIRTAADVACRPEHLPELERIADAPILHRLTNKELIDILFHHLTRR